MIYCSSEYTWVSQVEHKQLLQLQQQLWHGSLVELRLARRSLVCNSSSSGDVVSLLNDSWQWTILLK